jgi:hypothetical protein
MTSNPNTVAGLDVRIQGPTDGFFYELDGYYFYFDGSQLKANVGIKRRAF